MVMTSAIVNLGSKVLKDVLIEVFRDRTSNLINRFDIDIDSYLNELKYSEAPETYVRNFLARHGKIKILGMRDGKAIESIYTEAYVLAGMQDGEGMDSVDELLFLYEKMGDLYSIHHNKFKKVKALDYIGEHHRIVIIGAPGAGKTTLLRKVGIEFLKGERGLFPDIKLIPVFIPLKIFWDKDVDIKKAIFEELRICRFPKPEAVIDQLLEKGGFVLILDAVDELPPDKKINAVKKIQDFADTYNANRFIISSRVAAYRKNRLNNFVDVEIASLGSDSMQETIDKWFYRDPIKGQKCWKKLMDQEYKSIRQLANTPLLLTLICILFSKTGQFPANRSTLYAKALRVLLEEWREDQGVPSVVYQGLDTRRKEIMIASLASDTFSDNSIFIWEGRITRHIEDVLQDMLSDAQINGREILENIETQHGLLVKQAEGIYSFSHESMQEFLTAQHISESYRRIQGLINKYITDSRWNEVFLFLAGLKFADDLLEIMEEKSHSFIQSKNITSLLKWLTQKTTYGGTNIIYRATIRRIAAVHIITCLAMLNTLTARRASPMREILQITQELIYEIDSSAHRNIYGVLRQIRVFIACLTRYVIACKNDSDRNHNYSNTSSDRNQALKLLLQESKKAAFVLEQSRIFPDFNGTELARSASLLEKPDVFKRINTDNIYAQRIANKILYKWFHFLDIKYVELKSISSKEFDDLKNYLECNILITKCSKAAVQVSRKKRMEVENGILFEKWVTFKISNPEANERPLFGNSFDDVEWRG